MQNYHLQNRPNREITDSQEILEILRKGKYATISMCRSNEPYIVTLSYGFDKENNALFFHCSPQGLKMDFIKANPLVCATIMEDGGYIANECGHHYRSVVFWGKMEILKELDEKKHGMSVLLHHLESSPDVIKEKALKSEAFYSKMEVLKLSIDQIHGKMGR